MKNRFTLFQRSGVYYSEDTTTGRQTSLRTKDKVEAERLLAAKNEAIRQPAMNLQIAQVYLQHGDPALAARTWQNLMDQMASTKTGVTQARWKTAIRDEAFDLIRHRKLIETNAEHFLAVLKAGTISTNMFLRKMHNFAVNMHWLPLPVLPKPNWPVVRHKERRAITRAEHQKIINREFNPAIRAYYQLLWHLGGAQSDIAALTAEDIDWNVHTIAYRRQKTGAMSLISFGNEVAGILRELPKSGLLFPALARIHHNHRAKMFIKRLKTVGVSGVSLHSYRYAWAERAKEAGYPERFAMQALGHSSKAVHRAYAGMTYILTPPDNVIITPWDVPSMFFWTVSYLLWQRNYHLLMVAVIVLGTAFKETVAVTAFLFFFTTLSWRARWTWFGATFVACLLLKLWITYSVLGSIRIFTADSPGHPGFNVFMDLINPHVNHFIWVNAGTFVLALCLPMRTLNDRGTKFILFVFLAGLTWACVLANSAYEFRQFLDVLPISVLFLVQTVQRWQNHNAASQTQPS